MWIGERSTEKGVGNGISIVLVINIISRIPSDMKTLFDQFVKGKAIASACLAVCVIIAIILALVVFTVILQDGERRIAVQYSQKIVGRRSYGGQSTNIPLKVNTAGVIPIIFSSSLMQFPIVIASFLGKDNGSGIGSEILRGLNQSNWCNPEQIKYSWGLVLSKPASVYLGTGSVHLILCILCIFLYSDHLQSYGDRKQYEEERWIHTGNSSGKTNSRIFDKNLELYYFCWCMRIDSGTDCSDII